jgi:molybdopterin synthase catalytic subunit
MQITNIKLCDSKIELPTCVNWIQSESCGGIDIFIGTVRNQTKGKDVLHLDFEAYGTMALKEMEKIAIEAFARFDIEKILIHHATGTLDVGAIAVVIAVAAAHRAAAFDACRFAIDTLKEKVPIWKKEVFEGGEVWVAAHP